jgi:hypothetical protein
MPLRVRLTKGFGLTASESGLLPTTDMPDCQYIYCVVRDPVIDEVPDAAYKQAPDTGKARSPVLGADSWLFSQESKALREIVPDCTGCRGPILGPPFRGGSDVLRRAR